MKEKAERVTEFLTLCMGQMHSYHDHKERMAHAAVLVQLALVGAVLSTTHWPPQWVSAISIPSWVSWAVASLGVAALWWLTHIYMRWQLKNRRVAAIYVAVFLKVLRAWAASPPNDEELNVCKELTPHQKKVLSKVTPDEGIKGYPNAFVDELVEQVTLPSTGAIEGEKPPGTGAFEGEKIVTKSSYFLGLILVVRAVGALF